MTGRKSESGFTLLEVLVASMLLGMLITILTMVFNSSSIAWSTGKAGVAEMDATRNSLAAAAVVADNLVPGVERGSPNTWGVLVSPWKADGALRGSKDDNRKKMIRGIEKTEGSDNNVLYEKIRSNLKLPNVMRRGSWVYDGDQLWADLKNLREMRISGKAKACVVGVWSLGPDGKENTGDDISTWPDLD